MSILRHSQVTPLSGVRAKNGGVGLKMYKFHQQRQCVVFSKVSPFIPKWFTSCLQLLACVCHKPSPAQPPTNVRAHAYSAKFAQKITPNITISNPRTQTAVADVDLCPILTAQVVLVRTRSVTYPLSLFLSLALLNLGCSLARGLILSGVLFSWARIGTIRQWVGWMF